MSSLYHYNVWREGKMSSRTLKRAHQSHIERRLQVSKLRMFGKQWTTGSRVNGMDVDNGEDRYLIVGKNDGTVEVYDLDEDGIESYFVKWHNSARIMGKRYPLVASVSAGAKVDSVEWFPTDSGMFTTSTLLGTLKCWDTNTLKVVRKFTKMGQIFSHSQQKVGGELATIAITSRKNIILCDIRTGTSSHTLSGHAGGTTVVRFSPFREHIIYSGSKKGELFLWDIRQSKSCLHAFDSHVNEKAIGRMRRAHTMPIRTLAFSQCGDYFISSDNQGHHRMWDLHSKSYTLKSFSSTFQAHLERDVDGHLPYSTCFTYHSQSPHFYCPSESIVKVYSINGLTTSQCNSFQAPEQVCALARRKSSIEIIMGCINGVLCIAREKAASSSFTPIIAPSSTSIRVGTNVSASTATTTTAASSEPVAEEQIIYDEDVGEQDDNEDNWSSDEED
eukprot:m.21202 g.21202  ORF g.21202 m.21202 type:complete len:446 (+) comp5331_c0_seq1:43-1380(+)